MSCLNEEQIQQYLDNEYGNEEKEVIKRHLETCPGCQKALARQRQRWADLKQSLDLLVTAKPAIPPFRAPKRNINQKKISVKYLLPIAVAAGLLLLLLFRLLSDSDQIPINGQNIQFVHTEELDANKPVTDYPLIMTIVEPDGTVTQTTIN